jgi:hypothetical protein
MRQRDQSTLKAVGARGGSSILQSYPWQQLIASLKLDSMFDLSRVLSIYHAPSMSTNVA